MIMQPSEAPLLHFQAVTTEKRRSAASVRISTLDRPNRVAQFIGSGAQREQIGLTATFKHNLLCLATRS